MIMIQVSAPASTVAGDSVGLILSDLKGGLNANKNTNEHVQGGNSQEAAEARAAGCGASLVEAVTRKVGGNMARGKKSPLWHELKRREHMVTYLQNRLDSGNYRADAQKAIDFIATEKLALAVLESQLQQEV